MTARDAIDSAAVSAALRRASYIATVGTRTVDMRGEEYRLLRSAFDSRTYQVLTLDGRRRDVYVHECEEHLGSLTATFKLVERPLRTPAASSVAGGAPT